MCDNLLLNIICAAEATGELDEPTISTLKVKKYWDHPVHSKIEYENYFSIFYENIRKFPLKLMFYI
jgi:hypothetical protein